MTFSFVPPKSIVAIINLSSLGVGSMSSVHSNELLILNISAHQSIANADEIAPCAPGKDEVHKSEGRNPRSKRSPKPEIRTSRPVATWFADSEFGFRISFGFRPSVFGL
jgi:hypothetical protein